MTNKLVVIINSLKVPKIKKLLLYEMKFHVLNYTCLQNLWLGGLPPPDPRSLCPMSSTEFVEPSPRTKFLGTPLSRVVFTPRDLRDRWDKHAVRTLKVDTKLRPVSYVYSSVRTATSSVLQPWRISRTLTQRHYGALISYRVLGYKPNKKCGDKTIEIGPLNTIQNLTIQILELLYVYEWGPR